MIETHMPFGKHFGKPLTQLPRHYLRWALSLDNLQPHLARAIQAELSRRGERYLDAMTVLFDLEEELTARVSADRAIDHDAAGRLADHVMLAFGEVRAHHGIGDETELRIEPCLHHCRH